MGENYWIDVISKVIVDTCPEVREGLGSNVRSEEEVGGVEINATSSWLESDRRING